MHGGLINLVAMGAQDQYLTSNSNKMYMGYTTYNDLTYFEQSIISRLKYYIFPELIDKYGITDFINIIYEEHEKIEDNLEFIKFLWSQEIDPVEHAKLRNKMIDTIKSKINQFFYQDLNELIISYLLKSKIQLELTEFLDEEYDLDETLSNIINSYIS